MPPRWPPPDQTTREDRPLRRDRAGCGSHDRIAQRRTTEESPQVFDRSLAHGHPGLVGGATQVRKQHHVLHGEELGRDLRLVLVDVEAGAGNRPVRESIHQGSLVHDVTPRGVDEKRAPPHPSEPLPVHEVARLRRGRAVERNEVRLFQNVFRTLPRLRPERGCFWCRGWVWIMKQDLHAEPHVGSPGHGARNAAHADQAESLPADVRAEHVGGTPSGPGSTAHVALPFPGPATDHEQQGHGDIGGGFGQHVGRVRYGEPACLGGIDVDVIVADAEVGQHAGAQRLGTEDLGAELVGYGAEKRVRGAQRVLQAGRSQWSIVAVESGVEVAGQLLLDNRRQPARHHHRDAVGHFTATVVRWDRLARAAATVLPSSAGLGATVRPAVRMISAFSAAVSPKAEMMAPAWPMRRPLGAVRPATYPITGLLIFSFTKSEPSASWGPPISPIIITASVSGSSSNSLSMSTKELPLIGSPPMPTLVLCPMPSAFICAAASYPRVPLRVTSPT